MFATATDLMWKVLEESGGKDPLIVAQAMDLLIDEGEELLAWSIEWMVKNNNLPEKSHYDGVEEYDINLLEADEKCRLEDWIFEHLPEDDTSELGYEGDESKASYCLYIRVPMIYKSFERAVRAISEALVKSGVITDGE